jgi:hypothetical protein
VLSDGFQWLCLGNATADMTTLAAANQAVSQIPFDNRPSAGYGDTYVQLGLSLACGSSGSAGYTINNLLQYLNPDGSTYGDGLSGGSNLSSALESVGTVPYSAGRSTPIVGTTPFWPFQPQIFRHVIQNNAAPLSASTHVVSIRTAVFGLNQ